MEGPVELELESCRTWEIPGKSLKESCRFQWETIRKCWSFTVHSDGGRILSGASPEQISALLTWEFRRSWWSRDWVLPAQNTKEKDYRIRYDSTVSTSFKTCPGAEISGFLLSISQLTCSLPPEIRLIRHIMWPKPAWENHPGNWLKRLHGDISSLLFQHLELG